MREIHRTCALHAADMDPTPGGVDLVLVNEFAAFVELLEQRLKQHGHETTACSSPEAAMSEAKRRSGRPPDLVIVDLDFPSSQLNGLDVMLAFKKWCPESTLLVYTAGGPQESMLLQVVWDSVQPACAVSKLSPLSALVGAIADISTSGSAEVDPRLLPDVPTRRSPPVTVDDFRRLVPHAGHAKLWQALLDQETAPAYKSIANRTELSINTIRNYRDDLLGELQSHGLDNPTMEEMHRYVHLVRPLLAPILGERLSRSAG